MDGVKLQVHQGRAAGGRRGGAEAQVGRARPARHPRAGDARHHVRGPVDGPAIKEVVINEETIQKGEQPLIDVPEGSGRAVALEARGPHVRGGRSMPSQVDRVDRWLRCSWRRCSLDVALGLGGLADGGQRLRPATPETALTVQSRRRQCRRPIVVHLEESPSRGRRRAWQCCDVASDRRRSAPSGRARARRRARPCRKRLGRSVDLVSIAASATIRTHVRTPRREERPAPRSALAAARHHRVPAHGRAAVRRPREVDQRARRGDGSAATRRSSSPRRSKAKTNEPTPEDIFAVGTVGHDHPAAAPARRHGEGAGRGQAPRAHPSASPRPTDFFIVEVEEIAEVARAVGRARGADALGARDLRDLRQAQQADPARDADLGADDRRSGAPRRHHRRRTCQLKLDRQAGAPRDGVAGEAARAALRADARRDRDPAGREEDPHARQEADGEDAEGVLPQRADAGDPEGAGRARRVQERDPGARREAQDTSRCARRRTPRSRRS